MDWTDLIIKVAPEDVPQAEAIAGMCVSRGLYIEDYSTLEEDLKLFGPVEVIDEELLAKDKTVAKIHVYVSPEENPAEFASFIEERLKAEGIPFEFESDNVKEEDWANNWKQYFKPRNIGKKLRLVPTWEAEADLLSEEGKAAYAEGRKRLLIDPGMAFGSGQHETTKLCMNLLEDHVDSETSLLDVGTGSGILGIAALLLGAGSVTGVDIDALSVKVAGENAELNGVGGKFKLICGDLAGDVNGAFSVICANIVADIIIRLLPDTGRLLKPGGVIIVSGIIDKRLSDVEEECRRCGLVVKKLLTEKGWCAAVLAKRS
ncbi:MAG: 50S ribosomal protein L11 methyltransferase [Clostridia bacterium]|nr:50S ribosomal protein L11 methyltransferase [Clostridia bacterium]MCR5695322.1 50S ribosomal protein L11 methyltransferase [Clostridia bacterium]